LTGLALKQQLPVKSAGIIAGIIAGIFSGIIAGIKYDNKGCGIKLNYHLQALFPTAKNIET
jgi:hypothetical protein